MGRYDISMEQTKINEKLINALASIAKTQQKMLELTEQSSKLNEDSKRTKFKSDMRYIKNRIAKSRTLLKKINKLNGEI